MEGYRDVILQFLCDIGDVKRQDQDEHGMQGEGDDKRNPRSIFPQHIDHFLDIELNPSHIIRQILGDFKRTADWGGCFLG